MFFFIHRKFEKLLPTNMESKYVYNTLEKLNNAQFRRKLSCNVDTIDINTGNYKSVHPEGKSRAGYLT